jgi:hypothetical protein
MSENKQEEGRSVRTRFFTESPPKRPAPTPPGRSMRTQPRLAVTLAAVQDLSFDASWKRAKDNAIMEIAEKEYPGVRLPTKKELIKRNNKKPPGEIDYVKFDKSFAKHRARHNLVVAHDFFPIFYRKLKAQIEPTLDNANDCLAMLGMQGTAVGEAAREAREYQSLAAKYGDEATDSRKKAKDAEIEARLVSESAGEEVRKTMKERREREREAQILVEMQAQAAKAMNEENAELRMRNTLLEKENIKLKSEMQMMQDQQVQLASQNAELMKENSEIRERASNEGSRDVGMLSLDFGRVDDSSAAAPKATRGRRQGWWGRKKSSNPKSEGTKGGKRKRTRKKCNNRRLTKKMLCVRGTKRRLKKLKKHTKRLKLKLMRCSKKRLAKNFSVRKKRKYTRRK